MKLVLITLPLDHPCHLFHPFHPCHSVHLFHSIHSFLVAQGDPPQSSRPSHPFHLFLVHRLCSRMGMETQ